MTGTEHKGKGTHRPVVFNMTANQCVWARAGVIKPTVCINAFDCGTCPFDRKMNRLVERGGFKDGRASDPLWSPERWLSLPSGERKCRHMLSGRVPLKYCANNFDCAHCQYDQMIEEEDLAYPVSGLETVQAGGFEVAMNYYYHPGHAWARIEYGGRIRVGLDDFAQRLVGSVDEFDLPKLGTVVRKGRPSVALRRDRLRAETLSPVEGVVVARNPKVLKRAQTAHEAPYGEGWLMVIEPVGLRTGLKHLMFEEQSLAWMEAEASRLGSILADNCGYRMAATGGRAVDDIYGQVPEIGWDRLVHEFLLT
ncbi:MAG: glycine cleavage system protein H [Proteobacteria bacterium]|nr:glycine cleavage system protein H [Pseudomonadota bacterium]